MLLLGGAAVWLIVAVVGGDDDDDTRGPDTTTTTEAEVSEVGQELLDRLAAGRERPLHLRLEPDGDTPEGQGRLTVELWRDGGRVRQDLVVEAQGFRNQLAAFQLREGTFQCQAVGEDWRCEAFRSLATESGAPAGIVEAAAATLAGAEVVASDETVAGREARCYAIETAAGASTMCVTAEGIPVRLTVEGQQLTATVVEDDVDGSVFDLPAEVTDPTVPTTAAP